MDAVSRELLAAQIKAEALFAEVVDRGLVSAGKLESELTEEIHALAQSRFGVRRHWHKRIARAGPNTLLTYYDESTDRRITDDDIVYLDFGPLFEAWEADFGRTFVLGHDPVGTGSYPATGLVRMPDGSMVGTTFLGGTGYGVVYRLTLPPSVSIQPAPITAIRTGRGILSRRASAVILNGQAPIPTRGQLILQLLLFTVRARRIPPYPPLSQHATPQKGACPSPSQTRQVGPQAGPRSSLTRPRVPPAGSATDRRPSRVQSRKVEINRGGQKPAAAGGQMAGCASTDR